MTDLRTVLIVGSDHDAAARLHRSIGPFLAELRCQTRRAPEGTDLLELVQKEPFQLIAVSHPLERPPLVELLRSVRWSESKCRSAAVLLVGEVAELATLEPERRRGINRIVPYDAPPAVMKRSIEDLLEVAPRIDLRTMVRVEMFTETNDRRMAQTDNISATGMLVQGRSRYEEGTPFSFEFTPPGQAAPIRGNAEVVRSTVAEREGIEGFAARFTDFEGDGEIRLRAFLASQKPSR